MWGEVREVPADSGLCLRMARYKAVFERLRAAASFTPQELKIFDEPLLIDAYPPNAHYLDGRIWVNWRFLNRFEADSPESIQVVAHEIGHAVQAREHTLTPDPTPEQSRRIEGQADLISRELIARAGFKIPLEGAIEVIVGCSVIRADSVGRADAMHPTTRERWLAAVRANPPSLDRLGGEVAALDTAAKPSQAAGRAVFDGGPRRADFPGPQAVRRPDPQNVRRPAPADTSRGDGRYHPSKTPADFDAQGRLPSHTPILDMRLRPAPPNPLRPRWGDISADTLPPAGWRLDVARGRLIAIPRVVFVPFATDNDYIASLALRACGVAAGLTYQESVTYGLDRLIEELSLGSSAALRLWMRSPYSRPH